MSNELTQRYIDLGQDASRIAKQREELKAEIEAAMQDGELLSAGDQCLLWEFKRNTKFDVDAALAAGKISKEVVAAFTSVSIVRTLNVRRRDDEGKQAEQQRLQRMMEAAAE